jgi:hypothetical protein
MGTVSVHRFRDRFDDSAVYVLAVGGHSDDR